LFGACHHKRGATALLRQLDEIIIAKRIRALIKTRNHREQSNLAGGNLEEQASRPNV